MPDLAIADGATPREIVTQLHDLIAGQHPELVAAYRQTPAARRVPPAIDPPAFPRGSRGSYRPRLVRLNRYSALRDGGASKWAAARHVGINLSTACRYEAILKGGRP